MAGVYKGEGYEAEQGRIFTKRRASKIFWCGMGDGQISYGQEYYAVTIAGGGLGSMKFPHRIHLSCRQKYLEKYGDK